MAESPLNKCQGLAQGEQQFALILHETAAVITYSVYDTVPVGEKKIPNGIGNKATLLPTATKSPPPQVKLVLSVAPSAKAWEFPIH
ncbi:hypothetical protein ACH5RR_026064 [Cinchona calisaya]|uniref:Uncharacterized protein n=1 Tax=Cinchona calisaya TaxID=153742 RepID=A0ABD2Z5F9_9GENT